MIRYQCPKCRRTLLIRPDLAGRPANCPCGAPMVVPKLDSQQPSQQELHSIEVTCESCERQLLVPASARGKAVACRCGKLVLVGESNPRKATPPPIPLTNFLSDLPSKEPTNRFSSPLAGPEFWYINYDRPDVIVEGKFEHASAKQVADEYLDHAAHELRNQRRMYNRQIVEGSMALAQQILMIVGLLIIMYNGYRFYYAGDEVNELMSMPTRPVMSGEVLLGYMLFFYGVRVIMGFVMMFLGALAQIFPRFCSVAGLLMHVVPNGLVLFLLLAVDPTLLTQGFLGIFGLIRIVVNIGILVGLIKAVVDGFMYSG
jgi:hypothetical protein